jgi:hypothetical protein
MKPKRKRKQKEMPKVLDTNGRCYVWGCGARATGIAMNPMHGKPDFPACELHLKRRLWWYKGSAFERD